MGRGDSSMPSVVMSSKEFLPDKARVSPWRVAPTVAFASVVAQVAVKADTRGYGQFSFYTNCG